VSEQDIKEVFLRHVKIMDSILVLFQIARETIYFEEAGYKVAHILIRCPVNDLQSAFIHTCPYISIDGKIRMLNFITAPFLKNKNKYVRLRKFAKTRRT
jgi:hypothetical protein